MWDGNVFVENSLALSLHVAMATNLGALCRHLSHYMHVHLTTIGQSVGIWHTTLIGQFKSYEC